MKYALVLAFLLVQPFLYSQGKLSERPKPLNIEYTDSEKKALRNEMIEMDINIRTLSSMISLNHLDRILVLFQRLSEYQMQNSPYYKNGIANVSRKWKELSLSIYMDSLHTEASRMVKYVEAFKDNHSQSPDWDLIYKANRNILENCQKCHEQAGVNLP